MVKHFRPDTLEETLEKMDESVWIPFAGGTDIMIRSRNWQGASRAMKGDVIFIQHLEDLRHLTETEEAYHIGANITQAEFLACDFLPMYAKEVVAQMATPAIRNVATIGGNISNAAKVADLLPLFYAVDAKVVLRSKNGQRVLPIEVFETGKYKTARASNELIVEVIMPKLKVEKFLYKKSGQRRASILSKISFLALKEPTGTRLAIGALNDTVIRSIDLEKQINTGADRDGVVEGYRLLFSSEDDNRSTKRYRETVAVNLIKAWMEELDEA
jgi:CO/xanthine dehydrogenase FAD-binding subunit